MLTRSQVAQRLGKSIATVRRLEDRVLHPTIGRRNVRYFDVWEVERLKQDPARLATYAQSTWFKRKTAAIARRTPGELSLTPKPSSGLMNDRRADVALELECLLEDLLDVPPARLLKAGLDERAFAVLAAAIEALRQSD